MSIEKEFLPASLSMSTFRLYLADQGGMGAAPAHDLMFQGTEWRLYRQSVKRHRLL